MKTNTFTIRFFVELHQKVAECGLNNHVQFVWPMAKFIYKVPMGPIGRSMMNERFIDE